MDGKQATKTLFLLMITILLIGDNSISSLPALSGIGILIYLLINGIIIDNDEAHKNQ